MYTLLLLLLWLKDTPKALQRIERTIRLFFRTVSIQKAWKLYLLRKLTIVLNTGFSLSLILSDLMGYVYVDATDTNKLASQLLFFVLFFLVR